MVTVDESLNEIPGGRPGRWQHPRLLLLLSVVALGLTANAVLSDGSFGIGLPPQAGGQGQTAAKPGYGETGLATLSAAADSEQSCQRIANIVHTACSLRQRDRDAEGIRLCTAYELKYTLWSAYGCR